MATLTEVYFLPPLAFARLGGSDVPLDAFEWETDLDPHGAHRTVIKPSITLEVLADGSLRPFLPNVVRFRDGQRLRPVAPFFELWARVARPAPAMSAPDAADAPESVMARPAHATGAPAAPIALTSVVTEEPFTLALLHEVGASMDNVKFAITVANRKAQRRTQAEADAFVARVEIGGTDHAPQPLLASSPHGPSDEPLVLPEHPIPLGTFQVIRPVSRRAYGVDLSVLRVRFTPARGEVYGPPDAVTAMAATTPPGYPRNRLVGRMHEIVKPENRILNGNSPWARYVWNLPGQIDPQPADSFDGAHEEPKASWGIVDDTCDGVIEAQVVVGGERFAASARIVSSCPDYAPDRRCIISFADDLADRDLPDAEVSEATLTQVENELADLFTRAFETLSQMNVDASRNFAVSDNAGMPAAMQQNVPGLPQIDARIMTRADAPYADKIPSLVVPPDGAADDVARGVSHDHLPYSAAALIIHAPLTDIDTLMEYLRLRPDRVRRLMRPPFGRFWQLDPDPGLVPAEQYGDARVPRDTMQDMRMPHRDARVPRDTMQDMRMPPFMRDSDENPLSLTWRQYREIWDLLLYFEQTADQSRPGDGGPRRREVDRLVQRVRPDLAAAAAAAALGMVGAADVAGVASGPGAADQRGAAPQAPQDSAPVQGPRDAQKPKESHERSER